MDSNAISSWEHRRSRLKELTEEPCITQAHQEALFAALHLPQTDENAANTCACNTKSHYLVDQNDENERLGRQLDLSMAILWSIKKEVRESNLARLRASRVLKGMSSVCLTDSSRDFISINCLESNREGTVELVRSRFDRKIYILKSTTKGAAKRGFKSNAPMNERRLLTLAQKEIRGRTSFTPFCIASFQSQASLHILMEYCPAGDLYHFLESAGQAPKDHEARNRTGGLLSLQYVRSYAIDMVAAVSWLHAQDFMHRDIKPGNWLIDRSGHLLMCDLASSAPFARFDEVPATANLPFASGGGGNGGLRRSKRNQRRVLYRHCCLIGTADYIAPEIFWSADLMSRRRQRQDFSYLSSMDASSTLLNNSMQSEEEGEDDDEPPPEGPGLYGPECDWWSVGVLLYEMVFKQLPFFSEKIADTMEMIKNHKDYFRMDHRVNCSEQLHDLITCLITDADRRLGTFSSSEVQQHPFFLGVDWSRPWQNPAPFIPHLETIADTSDGSCQPEPSILHSPSAGMNSQSFDAGPMNWSKVWANDANDFPGFPNSVEISRAALDERSGGNCGGNLNQSQHISEANLSKMSHRAGNSYFDQSHSHERTTVAQWSGLDLTWFGFSYVPPFDAFDTSQIEVQSQLSSSSPLSQKPDSSNVSGILSGADVSAPIESTPPQAKKTFDHRSTYKHRASLHRHAVQTATKMRGASGSISIHDGRFVTPVRQRSYSNLSDPAGNSSTAIPVPASPYPFPVAQSARPKKTPYTGNVLKRNDLERARSASASGEGSDSRCSGGSNAKREISEREAWRELKIAVMQSAKKGRRAGQETMARDDDDEEEEEVNAKSRAVNTSSDSVADESHVPKNALRNQRKSEGGGDRRSVRLQLTSFDKRPATAGYSQPRQPLEPILDLSPTNRSISPLSMASSASPAESPDGGGGMIPTLSALSRTTPKSQAIGRQKSARQLLLKAQHRDTPTRVARSASPMLTEPPGNLTAFLGKPEENEITRKTGQLTRMNSGIANTLKKVDIEPSVEPLGDANHTMAPMPIVRFQRPHSSAIFRRRESHEIMSQYRKGVNPEARLEDENAPGHVSAEEVNHTNAHMPKAIALFKRRHSNMPLLRHRGSLEIMSQFRKGVNPDAGSEDENAPKQTPPTLVINTAASNKINQVGGWLSSPGLPSHPDTFGGANPPASDNEGYPSSYYMRSVSAPTIREPLRTIERRDDELDRYQQYHNEIEEGLHEMDVKLARLKASLQDFYPPNG
ncbi:kinase-like protein [Meira miltonrushii]|uniref:Kinase-like protein n=1 Tax=Meira miltonrushii TaxID=1280837 RepID=A0A316VN71_9BASI|nr:kinase-like protein [Meira miltonrushii]PWN37863.1 kinase-like protein [Meira miltonrushii]